MGDEGFGGGIEIRGVSAIGDALVGSRGWNSKAVLRERDAILGEDEELAYMVVGRHRMRMREAWKEGFKAMMVAEGEEYGERSYFRSMEGLAQVAEMAGLEG